ncbi:MAG: histidine kinase [Candidatus Marinimicrobia bacterium]|nr:histidine kinase [Candidatus Neomarinimicrobiota bacterium]
MQRKWLEYLILSVIIGLIYFLPIQSAKLPVFAGQFNNLDGSLYAVRIFDLILSVGIILLASRLLIPRRLNWESLGKALFSLFSILILASLLEWGWDALTLRAFNLPTGPGEISDKMLLSPNRINLSLTIIQGNLLVIGIGIFYGFVWNYGQQVRQREQLELENLEAEVKFLRSQINHHFLFNTLNNIFAITQRNNDSEGSDAILRLSGLMRYMLYESARAMIDLQQEITHIQNYRELMLLKYKADDLPKVNFHIEGSLVNCQVAPLIFLPFVENAFKHGIDNHGKGDINITLKVSDNEINFSVLNSRFPDREASPEHRGIGLENVKKRLDLLYAVGDRIPRVYPWMNEPPEVH